MKTWKKILIGIGLASLGGAAVILGLRNSKLRGENSILKQNLSDLNKRCDDKDRYIGKILTELKRN